MAAKMTVSQLTEFAEYTSAGLLSILRGLPDGHPLASDVATIRAMMETFTERLAVANDTYVKQIPEG
jgi:hypothetical protein